MKAIFKFALIALCLVVCGWYALNTFRSSDIDIKPPSVERLKDTARDVAKDATDKARELIK